MALATDRIAIILAGGAGTRFGAGFPKQLSPLAGYTVLHYSMRRFDDPGLVDQIVVVSNEAWIDRITEITEEAARKVPYVIVPGGASRNESLRNALDSCAQPEAKVLIHDSVRPLVSTALIGRVLGALDDERCVLPVIPSADMIVRLESGFVDAFASRESHFRGQAPQGFYLSDLRTAFDPANDHATAGWSTVYEALRAVLPNMAIKAVEGELENLKITLPVDQMIAGRLLLEQ